ncbi:hypothetical protein AC249_AIPGENE10635 [Exaiptasia diaphana]|nr:hypothetical protein AC249_AIPGENE10635 [Exaiptasia diaphana]
MPTVEEVELRGNAVRRHEAGRFEIAPMTGFEQIGAEPNLHVGGQNMFIYIVFHGDLHHLRDADQLGFLEDLLVVHPRIGGGETFRVTVVIADHHGVDRHDSRQGVEGHNRNIKNLVSHEGLMAGDFVTLELVFRGSRILFTVHRFGFDPPLIEGPHFLLMLERSIELAQIEAEGEKYAGLAMILGLEFLAPEQLLHLVHVRKLGRLGLGHLRQEQGVNRARLIVQTVISFVVVMGRLVGNSRDGFFHRPQQNDGGKVADPREHAHEAPEPLEAGAHNVAEIVRQGAGALDIES